MWAEATGIVTRPGEWGDSAAGTVDGVKSSCLAKSGAEAGSIYQQLTKLGHTNMHEIICPHCHKAFKIDEAGYADILKQVRDGDFEKQLHERLELAEREKRDAIALAEANVTNVLQKAAAAKDTEIQALKAQLDAGEVARKLAVTEALGTVSQERDALANELKAEQERARNSSQAAAQLAEAKLAHALQAEAAKKDAEIQALQAKLEASETARQLAVNEAVGVVARERDDLKNDLNLIAVKNQLEEKAIKEQFALQLRDRDGEIARLRPEQPLRLVETTTQGSPWHELASSGVVRKATDVVPDFANFVVQLAKDGLAALKPASKVVIAEKSSGNTE
jgi:hypothetical protein